MSFVVDAISPNGLAPAVRTLSENVLGQVDAVELLHLKNIQDSGLFDGGWADDDILSTLDLTHEDRRALYEEQEKRRRIAYDRAKLLIAERLGGVIPAFRVTYGESVRTFLLDINVVDAVPVEQ